MRNFSGGLWAVLATFLLYNFRSLSVFCDQVLYSFLFGSASNILSSVLSCSEIPQRVPFMGRFCWHQFLGSITIFVATPFLIPAPKFTFSDVFWMPTTQGSAMPTSPQAALSSRAPFRLHSHFSLSFTPVHFLSAVSPLLANHPLLMICFCQMSCGFTPGEEEVPTAQLAMCAWTSSTRAGTAPDSLERGDTVGHWYDARLLCT